MRRQDENLGNLDSDQIVEGLECQRKKIGI